MKALLVILFLLLAILLNIAICSAISYLVYIAALWFGFDAMVSAAFGLLTFVGLVVFKS